VSALVTPALDYSLTALILNACNSLPVCISVNVMQLYGLSVISIDPEHRQVSLSDGSLVQYNALIATMPLDRTLTQLGKQQWAQRLTHSSTHIIGVGIRGHW
jgi:hypothetical protein